MAFRPGLVSITFRAFTVKNIIQAAVKNGLEGIEWGGDIHVPPGDLTNAREVRHLTINAGLEVAAYGSYYRAGASETAGLSFSTVCETAAALGAPTIRIWAGVKNAEEATLEYREQVTADISRVGALAAAAGMTVSLEFHGETLTNTVASTVQLLEATRAEQVRSYWQPPVGIDPPATMQGLRMILPRLSNVHVFHWWPDHQIRYPLEKGRSCWQQYLDLVQTEGREGWALLEFVRDDKLVQLEADARSLREILRNRA